MPEYVPRLRSPVPLLANVNPREQHEPQFPITTPIACASSSPAVAAPSSAVAVQTPCHLLDPNSDTGGSDIGSVNGDTAYAGSETDPEEATETKNARRSFFAKQQQHLSQ